MKTRCHILIAVVALALLPAAVSLAGGIGQQAGSRRATVLSRWFAARAPKSSNRPRVRLRTPHPARLLRRLRAAMTRRVPAAVNPVMPIQKVPLRPEATIHVAGKGMATRVVLNSVPTEGHDSVVLYGHGMLDTRRMYFDFRHAEDYGGPELSA